LDSTPTVSAFSAITFGKRSKIRVGLPPFPENYGKPITPVSPTERIASLDVVRGFAQREILIVDILNYSQPMEDSGLRGADLVQRAVADFFCYGPMEWLWRSLTLGACQPMIRERQLTPPP
jgi:uncharacterized membrane protein YeiB